MAITSTQLQVLYDAIDIAATVPSSPDCGLICATTNFIKNEGTSAQLDEICDMQIVKDCNCPACNVTP